MPPASGMSQRFSWEYHMPQRPAEQARILQEARRMPDRKQDATGTWSLTLLQRALREASNGLPKVSTFTILSTLHEAGYSWQQNRTWCHTGRTLKTSRSKYECHCASLAQGRACRHPQRVSTRSTRGSRRAEVARVGPVSRRRAPGSDVPALAHAAHFG